MPSSSSGGHSRSRRSSRSSRPHHRSSGGRGRAPIVVPPIDPDRIWSSGSPEEGASPNGEGQEEGGATDSAEPPRPSGDAGPAGEWRLDDPDAWARAGHEARQRVRDAQRLSRQRSGQSSTLGGSSRTRTSRPTASKDEARTSWRSPAARRRAARKKRERSRHPRRRTVKIGLLVVGLVLVAGVALVADAYWQVKRIADPVDQIRTQLTTIRSSLSHGKLPNGDPFNLATGLAAQAERGIDHANFAYRLVAKAPVLGRPMTDLRLAVTAADELSQGAIVARDMVRDVLGSTSERDTVGPANAPVFNKGRADIALIKTLPGRFTKLLQHLQAAEVALKQVKPIPLYHKLTDIQTKSIAEANQGIALARNGLSASKLLPSFLGVDRPRTYFFALQNNSDQRATGGAVLGFAFVRADDGRISLEGGGPIAQTEPRFGFPGVRLPSAVAWYLGHIPKQYPRISNLNFTPDFPTDAQAWAALFGQGAGVHIDGAIAIDPIAIASFINGNVIHVPSYPDPITKANAVSIIENKQYLQPKPAQRVFPSELISAAYPLLSDPKPFFRTLQQFGTALQEKHIQIWSSQPEEQSLIQQLKWDGSVQPGSGDLIYATDNKLLGNKVDYYTHTSLTYHVSIDAAGAAHSTATVKIDNRTPKGLPTTVVGTNAYGLNALELGLYVPRRAEWTGDRPGNGYPDHVEGEARVFARHLKVLPGKPQSSTFTYTVPRAVQTTSQGHVYQLVVQHQALVNPQTISVQVTLPTGATVKAAPGWTVNGNVATYAGTLSKDLVLQIVY